MSPRNNPGEIKTPFRDIDRADAKQLIKRSWWIVALNFVVPGSVQVVAGNKRLGRLGIIFTLTFWLFVLVAIVFALTSKVALFTLLISPAIATPLGVLLNVYAALILVSTLDALRLMYLHKVPSRMKFLAAAFLIITGLFNTYLTGFIGSTALTATNFATTVFKNTGSLETSKGRYNILLLGGDSGSNRFGLRPDSISVISISEATGVAVNIGLPRNLTHIQFQPDSPIHTVYPSGFRGDCGGPCFLNAIYKDTMDKHKSLYPGVGKKSSTAGIEATKSAVEWATGLKIRAYVLINMKSFVGLVDALGGITVNVRKPLPIGGQIDCVPASNEHESVCPDAMSWIEKGRQHMDGRTALWYARSRHNTNDYDRMKRQREVEKLVLKKIDLPTLLMRLSSVAGAGAKLIKTDIPSGSLPNLLDLALKAKSAGLKNLQLSYPTIQADNPDFWLMRHLVAEKLRKYK
jgi:LCP family protein required for cell wall assembly